MTYKLGKGSVSKLEGIDERMIAVVKYAISVTKQDFSEICGMRTIEEQKVLVAKGASQTMKSKHIDGLAVDLMAYVDGGRWELNLYDEIADAIEILVTNEIVLTLASPSPTKFSVGCNAALEWVEAQSEAPTGIVCTREDSGSHV